MNYRMWGVGYANTFLRVGGDMAVAGCTMQRLTDILNVPVDRPEIKETTALGAAYLAGLAAGVYPALDRFADRWRLERRFESSIDAETRSRKLAGWRSAVARL